MEVAMAGSGIRRQAIRVEYVDSTKTFAEVEAALDLNIPQLDPAIAAALHNHEGERAKELEHGSNLFIFLKRDHGALLRIASQTRKALQYEIGNPVTASMMTKHPAGRALCTAAGRGVRKPSGRSHL
jgi:hypothetical protein